MTKICLLGASGSIGRQTIDVIEKNRKDFLLTSFSVGHQTRYIRGILTRHKAVKYVYFIDKNKLNYYQKQYPNVTFFAGEDGLVELIKHSDCDMVVNALVGFAGLIPSIESLKLNKKLALANKESLIVGGDFINKLLKEGHGQLFPIDSEHSALWKCLKVDLDNVDKLILTASGGAFRKLNRDQLDNVKASDALKHPTWRMGNKITIDCATMVNKTFEVIEAGFLFDFPYSRIGITLHDESHLHSYTSLKTGGFRGELSKPDMRNPIKFAMYEGNIPFDTVYFDSLDELKGLHFHKFDINRYPVLKYAKVVLDKKGNSGAILNASNEIAVRAFLKDQIKFLDIEKIIELAMKKIEYIASPTLEEVIDTDKKTRKYASILVETIQKGGRI